VFVSSTTEALVASSSILSMVEPSSAIVRIKVERSTITMFSERFTRKRPKSPNYTQPSPSGYIFLPFLAPDIYMSVVMLFSKDYDLGLGITITFI
jgi:hypothetical protein